jgi:hypothetical protein
MAFTSGNDVNILQSTDTGIVDAGAGNDRYVLTNALLAANQTITINDGQGSNTLQLVDLTVTSSRVSSNATQLTLSNGAIVNINGADTFTYLVGGNALTGTGGTTQNFTQFATTTLGAASVPASGAAAVNGSANLNVGVSTPVATVPTFSVTAGAAAVAEAATATASFTVALTNRAAGTAYSVTTTLAATGGATAGTDFTNALTLDSASTAAGITLVNNVLTIPASSTVASVTLSTAVAPDSLSPEAGEGLSLTLSAPTGASAVVSSTAASATTTITDVPVTYTLTASAADVYEGAPITYTLTASAPVSAATTVDFSVVAGDVAAANQGTSNTNLNDFAGGAFNPSSIVIAAGQKTATYSVTSATDSVTELPEAYTVKAVIAGVQVATKSTTLLDGNTAGGGQTFTLTAGTDSIPGLNGSAGNSSNSGNDTIIGDVAFNNTTAAYDTPTLGAFDSINGGDGTDTLNVTNLKPATNYVLPSATLTNVENLVIKNDSGTVTAVLLV